MFVRVNIDIGELSKNKLYISYRLMNEYTGLLYLMLHDWETKNFTSDVVSELKKNYPQIYILEFLRIVVFLVYVNLIEIDLLWELTYKFVDANIQM